MDLTKVKSIKEVTRRESPPAIWVDLDSPGGKTVIGKEPVFRFWEWLLMLEVNGNTDLAEFSDHIPQMEGKEISQSEILSL